MGLQREVAHTGRAVSSRHCHHAGIRSDGANAQPPNIRRCSALQCLQLQRAMPAACRPCWCRPLQRLRQQQQVCGAAQTITGKRAIPQQMLTRTQGRQTLGRRWLQSPAAPPLHCSTCSSSRGSGQSGCVAQLHPCSCLHAALGLRLGPSNQTTPAVASGSSGRWDRQLPLCLRPAQAGSRDPAGAA